MSSSNTHRPLEGSEVEESEQSFCVKTFQIQLKAAHVFKYKYRCFTEVYSMLYLKFLDASERHVLESSCDFYTHIHTVNINVINMCALVLCRVHKA